MAERGPPLLQGLGASEGTTGPWQERAGMNLERQGCEQRLWAFLP